MRNRNSIFLKNFFVILLALGLISSLSSAELPKEVLEAKNSIKGKKIVSHIDFLASKYCRGRETGDIGMDVASKYISTVLYGAGVEPAGDFGNYYQNVKLNSISLGENLYLNVEEIIGGVKIVKRGKLEWDYLPIVFSAEKEISAKVVFAGYGITAPEYRYDDYKNIDVKGKIVLLMRNEPGEKDESSPFEGRRLSKHGTLLTKILNAQKHGAVGVLFTINPLDHKDRSSTPGYFSGTYWPELGKKEYEKDEDYKFMDFSPPLRIIGDNFGVKIPAVIIDGKIADLILGSNNSLFDIQNKIDKNLKPSSFQITGKKVSMRIHFKNIPVKAHNIIGKIEGSDPDLKDEVVIVGAHHDHVGKDKRGRVFGGADDNASGTAGVLEMARAFQSLKQKPKRTILFILFTAEEKGLLGSRYYVENPVLPLKKTIAMIALDMIGRNDVDQMSLLGRYQYPKLFKIINTSNKESVNLEFNFTVDEFIKQSDHFPFMRKKIPSVLFNSGMHDQLHRPEDTVDRIIPEKVEKVTQLVFLSLWKIANLPPGTSLTNEKKKPQVKRNK